MTNQKIRRPKYDGTRDTRTGTPLPPPGWERHSGLPASEFDPETWLEENGYASED